VLTVPEFPPDGPAPMESAMHYYKRNLGDYAKKAGRLSMLQHGAYTQLLDACYDREQFPTLEQALDWTWASTEAEVEAVKFVLSKFFTLEDGVYVQNRIREELQSYHQKAEINSKIAVVRESKKRDENARNSTNRDETTTNRAQDSTNRAPTVHEPSPEKHEWAPNHKPLTTNQEPRTINQETTFALADARHNVSEKPYEPPKAQVLRLNVQWTEEGFDIPSSIKTGFLTAYPAIKLDAEIAKAHAWVLSHPKNRKSNWGRFLNNWLQKAQDKAPTVTSWKDDPRFKGLA
jgi:uncharacterized protein YdaU (DUF1376 family)